MYHAIHLNIMLRLLTTHTSPTSLWATRQQAAQVGAAEGAGAHDIRAGARVVLRRVPAQLHHRPAVQVPRVGHARAACAPETLLFNYY